MSDVLTSRRQCLEFYSKEVAKGNSWTDLCPYAIAETLSTASCQLPDATDPYTGDFLSTVNAIEVDGNLVRVCRGGAHRLLAHANLDEYEISPTLPAVHLLETALHMITDDPCKAVVGSFLSVLVPISHRSGTSYFSSASFYSPPHCGFFTEWADQFIAPSVVFPTPCWEAASDNLYHEALHQQLIISLRCNRLILCHRPGFETDFFVDVPWRNVRWHGEQAFHGFFVYSRLAQYRYCLANRTNVESVRATLLGAAQIAQNCATTLREALVKHPDFFSRNGLLELENYRGALPEFS